MRVYRVFRVSTLACSGVALSALLMSGAAFAQAAEESVPPGAEPPTTLLEGVDAADDTGELAPGNEIVVQARRRDESVQDVPQTVNVVTAAQVEKLNLRNFTEIASVVPGLQMQSQNAFSNSATVRGISFAPQASGNNPSVEFYLNDAPISSAFLFQSTYDFGQFELQRGPQGTLRGRAAPSGSIAVTTRRPDLDELGVVVNGTITDLHARKVDGAFNLPVIAEVLAVRVAGVVDNDRANRVHSINEDVNPRISEGPYSRTKSIRGSVRFEPTNWAQFNAMYQDLHNVRHTFDPSISEALINPSGSRTSLITVNNASQNLPPTFTTVPNTFPTLRAFDRLSLDEQGSYNRQDQQVLIGNADFHFAGQRLSFVGNYAKNDFGVLASQDAANFFAPPRVVIAPRTPGDPGGFTSTRVAVPAGAPGGFDPVCRNEVRSQSAILTTGAYDQCTHSRATRHSYEARLASDERIAGFLDYVVGGFYDRNKNVNNLTAETPVIGSGGATAVPLVVGSPPTRSAILTRAGSTEKSVFGNLTAHLLEDALELSGGLRYIDYKSNNAFYQGVTRLPFSTTSVVVTCPDLTVQCTAPLATLAAPDPVRRDKYNKTVYTASAKYKITPDVMVYALTGSSWRPGPRIVGGFSSVQTPLERSFRELPPETSTSYEIGAKTSFLDGRGRFNISAYRQTFKNYPFRSNAGVFFVSTSDVGVVSVGNFNFVSPVPVRVKGVEGELSFEITDRWNVGLNASYSDGKIRNGLVACTDIDRNGVPDVNAPRPTLQQLQAAVGPGQTISSCTVSRRSTDAPKFSANAQSELGFDVGGTTDGFIRGLYSFYGKTANDPDNLFDDVGSYGLLNLYAGIRDEDGAWELTVFGKNVTREREVLTVGASTNSTSFQQGALGGNFTSPYRLITTTAPREFGITAKIALGSR